MARNSILSELQLLKVLPALHKGSSLLVQIDKGNTLNSFLHLFKEKCNHFESIRSPVTDQLKLLTAIATTIFLQVASSQCQNKSQLYITCTTTLKIASIPICYHGRSLPLPYLGFEFFFTIPSHAPKEV